MTWMFCANTYSKGRRAILVSITKLQFWGTSFNLLSRMGTGLFTNNDVHPVDKGRLDCIYAPVSAPNLILQWSSQHYRKRHNNECLVPFKFHSPPTKGSNLKNKVLKEPSSLSRTVEGMQTVSGQDTSILSTDVAWLFEFLQYFPHLFFAQNYDICSFLWLVNPHYLPTNNILLFKFSISPRLPLTSATFPG